MDSSTFKERNSIDEVNSLGILNMDNLKVFGDISYDDNNVNHKHGMEGGRASINDRLNNERVRALSALKKSQKGDVFKKPYPVNNKENLKGLINDTSSDKSATQLDHSDYVPFRRPNAINISDLVTDETINLESSSSCPPSLSKDVKVSFEPTEITGRSTLYNISVNDILASSFAPKARNLCENLQGGDRTSSSIQRHGQKLPSSNTSLSSFNGSRSLPRTEDMSFSKNTCTEESFNGGIGTFSFSSAGAGTGLNESEQFSPGELMQSRLVNDEISWAQEYAAIPTAALSEQAKAKAQRNSGVTTGGFNSFSTYNSIIADDPNFSLGKFFNMRSDNNIWSVVKSKSPDKCRTPVALVDEGDSTVTTSTLSNLNSSSNTSITPKIDNKTYTRIGTLSSQLETKKSLPTVSANVNHEDKDSGNSTDSSYLLSVSAIDRALCNLDIQSSSSGIGVHQQLLVMGKKFKLDMNPSIETSKHESNVSLLSSKGKSLGSDIKINVNDNEITDEEMIMENKENLDPKSRRTSGGTALCDTMSFSETLLNSSDMKMLQRSISNSRSPLSPIDVSAAMIRTKLAIDGGEEADNDEWPGTPITSNRRVRRTKSPRDKSPLQINAAKNDSLDATTPVNSRPSRSYGLNNKNKSEKESKSMSSTRLDGQNRNSAGVCDFGISPNISNSPNYSTSLVVRSNSLVVPQQKSPRSASPTHLDNSPMSSPRSYQLPQGSSPTPTTLEFRSPNLDSTPNSDRHLLSAADARKVISSPAGSESSSTCSYGTMQSYRSAMSATSGRSVSRCSSSSEFCHRDGKPIPLKITNMELSWGSTKLRSDSRKSMQIKNIIDKRLVIRIEVSGPGFQIVNSNRSNTITLHSQECRSIVISFCPTVSGVAIGKLSFHAPCGAPTIGNSFLDVPLFGYGGNASIVPQNIFVGPVGSPFVTMGDVCELTQPLERTITFYNKGPLLGFASLTVDSIGLMMPRISDAFEIHPSKILIPPKHVVNVHVVFRPKREDIKKLVRKMGVVLTLANLRVICGDEPNRQRIRRLLSKMSEEERRKISSSALDMLWTKFPQEIDMPELYDIKENPSVAVDLTSYCRIHEILLTINHDNMDETSDASSLFLADVDETVLFRTICATADSPSPSSNLGTIDEDEEINDHVSKSAKNSFWSVSPETLCVNLNKQSPITLCIHNRFKSRQYFEVVCNLKEMFHFTPTEGYVPPDGGQTEITIVLLENVQCPSERVYITVYMDNERIVVPVNITK